MNAPNARAHAHAHSNNNTPPNLIASLTRDIKPLKRPHTRLLSITPTMLCFHRGAHARARTDADCRFQFRKLLTAWAWRRNHKTGVLYRNDPTILGFNLLNEVGHWDPGRGWKVLIVSPLEFPC